MGQGLSFAWDVMTYAWPWTLLLFLYVTTSSYLVNRYPTGRR